MAGPAIPSLPDAGTALAPLGASFLAELTSKLVDVWPALLPFVLLRVGFGVLEWWLERRDRRSKPEQLQLF